MKSIFDLCVPRDSVFDNNTGDDALDLRSLKTGNINAEKFFAETFMTAGLTAMVESAFKRLAGRTDSHPIIKLTQSMGGGKTHLLITTALLANDPVLRYRMFGDKYNDVENVKIVSYTGRDSDIRYGIWGEIAKQLGKEDLFREYYNPLSAPGQEAWINLLKDNDPTLILLDELPPYLEYAKAVPVGTGNLADYTVAALSNLFNAVASPELNNTLIVISDLSGNYMQGSELIEAAFNNATRTVNAEVDRLAYKITPVKRDNDDLYNILKKKCFSKLPEEGSGDVNEIANGYRDALSNARQSGTTLASPESLYSGIIASYPFHPSLKDLLGRFKDNENFQQTRGCIRLVRNMVRRLWAGNKPSDKYLINAYDVDLNDVDTYNTIKEIKPELEGAIGHDIVSQGATPAQAEECDREMGNGTRVTEEVAKLILMSSLSTIPNAILGLNKSDMAAFMVTPTFSVTEIGNVLENFKDRAWYLFAEDERLFFKQNRNIKAQIADFKNSYVDETIKRYIKDALEKLFRPEVGDVYQKVLVFPGTDEITPERDKITLILFEPNTSGGGLSPALVTWYNSQTFKNRVCFLTGQHNSMEDLKDRARDRKAVETVIADLKNNNIKENDSQMQLALEYQVRAEHRFKSALKEIFVTLYYPSRNGIQNHEIEMDFKNNNFVAEDQIRNLLQNTVQKFITASDLDSFRRRIENRLFTTKTMAWSQLEARAAEREEWNWYKPGTLRYAKDVYIQRGYWVESNGIIDKEPPKPKATVAITETNLRNGAKVVLSLNPLHGDTIYCEIGQPATTASRKIPRTDWEKFETSENKLYFLCMDSRNEYETGESVCWENKFQCSFDTYDDNGNKMVILSTNGKDVEIRYTIDGSNPCSRDATVYIEPFSIPNDNIMLQFVPYIKKYGFYGNVYATTIRNAPTQTKTVCTEIEPDRSLTLNSLIKGDSTRETYDLLSSLDKVGAKIYNADFQVTDETRNMVIEFSFSGKATDISECRKYLDTFTEYFGQEVVFIAVVKIREIRFSSGRGFSSWVADTKREISDFNNHFRQD